MNPDIEQFNDPWPNLEGQTILVTGGTGSFGQAFIKSVLHHHKPKKLIVFSRDELKQFEMQSSSDFQNSDDVMRYFIGDVRDLDRLEMAMRGVDVVIHAAALKQVPAAEYNPFECIHTNVIGAENVVKAALRCDVKKVIALSTDKASSPLNLYGASKLASDKIFVAGNNLSAGGTKFSVVRYGNVIGSRGSVVPFFENLRDNNAEHLPITDTRMTRFWITLEQGVNFVLSCLSLMHGGEIFVPKIPSTLITDVATAIAPDMEQKEVGIRPGEKLHEIMITADDSRNTYAIKDRYIIVPNLHFWDPEIYKFEGMEPVENDFSYASDNNPDFISVDGIKVLLNEARK